MAALLLESLQIRNFRVFRQLEVPSLGRVNLIVGKNNTGKSSILEALRMYAREGHPNVIWDILTARGESKRRMSRETDAEIAQRALEICHLLHNRTDVTDVQQIHIGSLYQHANQLMLSIGWYATDERGRRIEQQSLFEEPKELFLVVESGSKLKVSYNLTRYFSRPVLGEEARGIHHIIIPAAGLHHSTIGVLWDAITLTDREEQVIQALKIIEPAIEGLRFIEGDTTSRREPVVRTSLYSNRLPLRSLGEGVNRLLGIVLALVNAQDGLLLIDEIESGLHYSIQPEMWHLVFRVAQELNIQVFATTHSKDCVEAFQQAASADPADGVLIRLGHKRDDIVASIFTEDDLEIAVEQNVEVR